MVGVLTALLSFHFNLSCLLDALPCFDLLNPFLISCCCLEQELLLNSWNCSRLLGMMWVTYVLSCLSLLPSFQMSLMPVLALFLFFLSTAPELRKCHLVPPFLLIFTYFKWKLYRSNDLMYHLSHQFSMHLFQTFFFAHTIIKWKETPALISSTFFLLLPPFCLIRFVKETLCKPPNSYTWGIPIAHFCYQFSASYHWHIKFVGLPIAIKHFRVTHFTSWPCLKGRNGFAYVFLSIFNSGKTLPPADSWFCPLRERQILYFLVNCCCLLQWK